MYFDPITEKFDIFFCSKTMRILYFGLGVLNECLCIDMIKENIEILSMKEYGVKKSWTSLFIISDLQFDPSYGLILPRQRMEN